MSLDAILNPSSVAVVGATPRRGTIGHELLRNIVQFGFNGMLFPVNPKHKFIQSIKCYPSVLDVPDPVDLAVVVVPKEHVPDVAEQCGRKGVKGLVIISAGFAETGGEGVERERQLAELKERYSYRIIGPNCMGVINASPTVRLNATFAPLEPTSGSLAFMTQSGALGVAILLLADRLNLGLSYFVSVGNKVDVSGNDLLEFWESDEKTRVIGLYLESFGAPRRFTELAKRITRRKPIIVVKSGRTPAGSRAASSHTGRLAGMENAVEALLLQCGVIRVSTIQQMMDVALAFTRTPVPRGDSVAIVTNAGGPGIMATDALVGEGLSLAVFSDKTLAELRKALPEESSVRNPVDMVASAGPEQYEHCLDCVLADPSVDVVIVIFVPPLMIEPRAVVEAITRVSQRYDKPVFSVMMAEERYYTELPRDIEGAPPLFRFPESAVRAIAAMRHHRRWCERPEGEVQTFPCERGAADEIIDGALRAGGGFLSPTNTNRMLEAYGFPVCRLEVAPTDGDITKAAKRIGYPLVLKVYGPHIVHKSDYGGVAIDIRDEISLLEARDTMLEKLSASGVRNRVEGFLVQEMAQNGNGKEVILGMTTDATFGPLLMFGMGGKYVEILGDITFRVMPVADVDAWEMVRGIKSYPLLEGVRGEQAVDIGFVVESIQRLAQMVADHPDITELDMNPVVVTGERASCRVVDARIKVLSE